MQLRLARLTPVSLAVFVACVVAKDQDSTSSDSGDSSNSATMTSSSGSTTTTGASGTAGTTESSASSTGADDTAQSTTDPETSTTATDTTQTGDTDTGDTDTGDTGSEIPPVQFGDCPEPGAGEDRPEYPNEVLYLGAELYSRGGATQFVLARDQAQYQQLQSNLIGPSDLVWPEVAFPGTIVLMASVAVNSTCGLRVRSSRVWANAAGEDPQLLLEVEDSSGSCDGVCDEEGQITYVVAVKNTADVMSCAFRYDVCDN